jgi:photosystem II stability/assembly factor-like uncharacterized protein
MRLRILALVLACILALPALLPAQKKITDSEKTGLTSPTLAGLKFRSVGPAMTSGRIGDIAVDPTNPARFFVAVASGGVWRTTNFGNTFTPVFDAQGSYSIGCVVLDPTNPHTVWVGTGENNSQRSVGFGDGVYRSDDGGTTWKNMGLKSSEHIGKILIDPRDPRVVYVAAQGPLWAPGGERGLYKTTDGGVTWNAVLEISENTGVTDAVFDPRNPDIIVAASYQRRRHVWTLINGGPEARMFRTTDGGKSWDTLRTGLPTGDVGRIGLAVSPANPDIVYAIIEAADDKGGVYRSTDRGASWEKRNGYVSNSPQYYQELVCDPRDADKLYSLDTYTKISEDGGKTWRNLGNRYRHVDDHALWIDPADTQHLLIGGDGGLYRSHDGGATWRFQENLPVAQFYRVAVDNAEPFYNIYGGTQDNNSLGGPAQTRAKDGIFNEDWFFTNGGDGFESQIDPTNPDIVYAQAQYGWLVRFDKKSGERLGIQPQAAPGEEALRWNWDSPLLISPHNPARLYFSANKVFRSDDRGESWRAVSGDLTRRTDRNTLPVMGRIWPPDAVAKNASTSFYGNIVSFDESRRTEGLLVVGSDDGLIQISENGGGAWRQAASAPGVPERVYVTATMFSRHDDNILYAAFNNHKMGDFKPYVMRSADRGRTWTSITANLPARGPVHCIAEDHVKPGLLFVGTEFGVFVTTDGGGAWTQLTGGLPTIAVEDIAIQERENDLVIATFGRGFYVLDNYAPLRDLTPELLARDAHVFAVEDARIFVQTDARERDSFGETFFVGENPPFGAVFTVHLKDGVQSRKDRRRRAEKDAEKGKLPMPYASLDSLRAEDDEEKARLELVITDERGEFVRLLTAPVTKGVQRIVWDARYAGVAPAAAETDVNKSATMMVMPGTYQVTLARVVDGERTLLAQPVAFVVRALGGTTLPAGDPAALVAFQRRVAATQRTAMGLARAIAETRTRVTSLRAALQLAPATPDLHAAARRVDIALRDLERALNGDPIFDKRNEPKVPSVMGRLQYVAYQIAASTSGPAAGHTAEIEHVRTALAPLVDRLRTIVEGDLRQLEQRADDLRAPWSPGRIPRLE